MKGLTFKLEEWRDGKTQGEMTRQGWKVISSQELSQEFHKEKMHTQRGGSLGKRNLMIIANKCISSQQAYQNGEIYPYQKNIGTVSKMNDGSQLKWDQHQR